jgi:hypothetical protein
MFCPRDLHYLCRDWFQLTLKEGLTVYREQEFYASRWSAAVSRIEDVHTLRCSQVNIVYNCWRLCFILFINAVS